MNGNILKPRNLDEIFNSLPFYRYQIQIKQCSYMVISGLLVDLWTLIYKHVLAM